MDNWLSFFMDNGCSCIPLRKDDKKPSIKWKKYTEEKLPKEEIEQILTQEGSKNIGIVCGEISDNLLVIDIDNAELLEKLNLGELAAGTLTVKTAKGYHFYIKFKPEQVSELNDFVGEKGVKTLYYPQKEKGKEEEAHEEIRFQWREHYVVGPGSVHPSGAHYEHFLTSPRKIVRVKGIGLVEEIERRWESFRKIKKEKNHKTIKEQEPLFDFIKRFIKPKEVSDEGDRIKLLCPFPDHTDTVPSFNIYKEDEHFYCFGCERGGKHIEFLMYLKGISRNDAMGELGITSKKGKKEKEERKYATFVRFGDGRVAEEIFRDGVEQFVLFDPSNMSWEYVNQINNGGDTIYPLPILDNQHDSLILPDGIETYGSLKELRKEMLDFALEEFDPVDNFELMELMVHLELLSWIAGERMKELSERFIPIITIRGPSETGKKRFLTIARWLTYRSLYALKTTKVPTLFRSLSPWKGTMILDEADLADSSEKSEFVEFMNSRADGVPIPRYNSGSKEVEFFYSFGMSILAERSSSADDGYESRKIIFPSDATMEPEKYSLIPPKGWTEKGKALQRKLLFFRLSHLNGEVPTNLIIDGIKGFRVRESLLLLHSLSNEDEEITKNLGNIAKKLEERIITERSGSMEGIIMNIIYNALMDDSAEINQHKNGYEIIREYKGKENTYVNPLTLKSISKSLGDVLTPSEVARRWRGLGQNIRSRGRIEGKLHAGIIQITNPKRFIKEIGKYVLDIDYEALNDKLNIQQKLFMNESEKKPPIEEMKGVSKILRDFINELEKDYGEADIEVVINLADAEGIERENVEEMIELMKRDGLLYSPQQGYVKFVR